MIEESTHQNQLNAPELFQQIENSTTLKEVERATIFIVVSFVP